MTEQQAPAAAPTQARQMGGASGMLGLFGLGMGAGGYAALHERGPVLRTGFAPIVVGFDEVSKVVKDPEHFSNRFALGPGMASAVGQMAGAGVAPVSEQDASTFALGANSMMLTTDPPDHTRLRGVVAKAFTPRSVAALEPRVRELARTMLEPLRRGEPYEVMSQLAYPLPVTVIAELLGVPPRDRDPFQRWSEDLASTQNPVGFSQQTATSAQSFGEAIEYFQGIIDERRRRPQDDLITRLVQANEGGILSNEELIANSILLLIAGYETTVQLICNAVRTLASHEDQRSRLAADTSLAGNAVEEVLRFDGVVPAVVRVTQNGAVIAGDSVADGTFVIAAVSVANRDPAHFPGPDAFDISRDNAAHNLGFGGGIHYCVGAPLARLEVRVVLEELVAVTPHWVLTDPSAATAPGFIGMRGRRVEIAAA